jgi:hypothetical protein
MQRRTKWIAALVVALVLAAGAIFLARVDTVREVLDIAAEGGEMQLTEPMRPIRGTTRVLLIALDGVGGDKLREVVRAGRMPWLSYIFGAERGDGVYAHAFAASDAMSILPSTTMAAWSSVFTGQPVALTGVSGNEWFEREEARFYAPGPISVPEHTHVVEMYTNNLLGGAIRAPTLYELVNVRSHVALAPVFRGADLLTFPALNDVGALFGRLARGLTDDKPVDRKPYQTLDQSVVERALAAIERHGVPDLQVVYFPGIDLYGHIAEQPLQELERYLEEVIDPVLGRLFEAYRRRGLLETTYIVITSDHGHTPVLKHECHALGRGEEGEPPELLKKLGFRVRPAKLDVDADEADFQAVLAYQGTFAYIYLADRSTCPNPGEACAWGAPPRFAEDVMPVVQAFHQTNATGFPVAHMRGTIDLIFTREPRRLDEPALPFQIFDGERLVTIAQYLEKNPRPDLIDLEERMNALAAGPFGHRVGDVVLMAKTGMHRPIEQRFYFSGLYHSWHGGAQRQDSNIPLIVARRGTRGEALREVVSAVVGDRPSQLHVTPLVQTLLGR